MSQENKPHVNVGTIGHIGHGKTTLTQAITSVLAEHFGGNPFSFHQIDSAPEEPVRGININISHVEYDTSSRHYAHIDCPSHQDYVKSMISGAAQMDGAVLVVAATDGAMPQTHEHIQLARQAGVQYITVFLNKCDIINDEDMLDLVEIEVRELLSEYDFFDENIPVIRGSALGALKGEKQWQDKIIELAEALDTYIPEPERAEDQPFLMPIENVVSIPDSGIAVTGRVERGIIKVGEKVEIVGLKNTIEATCTGVQSNLQGESRAGENAEVLLHGVNQEDIGWGQVLAKPRTITPHTKFESEVYLLSEEEGGRSVPFGNSYSPQFYFRTADVTGTIELPTDVEMAVPGNNLKLIVTLTYPIAMDVGLRFTILDRGRTVGVGIVTYIIR